MKVLLLSFVVLVCTTFHTALGQNGQDLISKAEESIGRLAEIAESAHNSRCGSLSSCECSQAGCKKKFDSNDGWACSTTFGASHSVDSGEATSDLQSCLAQIRNLNASIVRLPTSTSTTQESEEFICGTTGMDSTFQTNYQSGNLTAWQYFGHFQGGIRLYPGSPQDNSGSCSSYDARLRPWFLSAASGPRDVVIVIDRSGSMDSNGRMGLVRCATSSLLSTLSFADYFDVVYFDDQATAVNGALTQATESAINSAKSKIDSIEADGGTYFNRAFTRAFNILSGSTRSSGCQKVILFLSDGVPGDSGVVSHISRLMTSNSIPADKLNIFTFGMGSGADGNILKSIACAFNGAYSAIADGNNPLEQMSAYYKFLAAGIDDSTVRWTEPYIDAFGMGEMVTASRAVYDRTTSVPILVGVVGTDITTNNFFESGDALLSTLLERTRTCPTFNISECQMQLIRQAETGSTCSGQVNPSTCSESVKPGECPTTRVEGTSARFCSSSSSSVQASEFTCCDAGVCGAAHLSMYGGVLLLISLSLVVAFVL